jgi:hypothetical protein
MSKRYEYDNIKRFLQHLDYVKRSKLAGFSERGEIAKVTLTDRIAKVFAGSGRACWYEQHEFKEFFLDLEDVEYFEKKYGAKLEPLEKEALKQEVATLEREINEKKEKLTKMKSDANNK